MSVHPLRFRYRPAQSAPIASDADDVVLVGVELRVQDGVVLPHEGLLGS
jgi:hypothetical protein